jgi:hypothetical protein
MGMNIDEAGKNYSMIEVSGPGARESIDDLPPLAHSDYSVRFDGHSAVFYGWQRNRHDPTR